MIGVDLYRADDDDETLLGRAYLDAPPQAGTVLGFSTPESPQVCWRVTLLYVHPAQEGSATVRAVQCGKSPPNGQVAIYTAFVEATEGPYRT